MTTSTDETTTDRQSIADVFATFYEDLYRRRPPDDTVVDNTKINHNNHDAIQPFSMSEVANAISQLRSGKYPDTSGLLAEMLKAGGPILRSDLRQPYNDALSPNDTPPTGWKRTVILSFSSLAIHNFQATTDRLP